MRAIVEWHLAFEKGFSVMVSQRGAITGARRAAVALSLAHARMTHAPHALPVRAGGMRCRNVMIWGEGGLQCFA